MAADLHDGPIQRLTGLTIRLESAKRAAARGDWRSCEAGLDTTGHQLQSEIGQLRGLMKDLRPPVLDERGLLAALTSLASETHQAAGLRVSVAATTEDDVGLDEELETALYRIAQEALTNVVKHAGASTATIALTQRDHQLEVEIADDGCGFDPEETSADGHFGLVTMRERAEMTGGSLSVSSDRGRGTRIRVLVPLHGPGGAA
jgi:two-component system sensor histidine kinase UhpB